MAIGGVLLALQYLLILRPCFLPKCTKLELNFDINLCLILDEEYLKPIILESEEILFKFTQYNGDCNLQTKQRPTCHVRGISRNKYLITTILLLCNDIQLNPGPCKNPGNLSESLDDQFISLNQLKRVKGLRMIHLNSKAFDLIDHSILKTKLKSIGIRGCAYSWLEDYLSGRTQTVCLNGSNSEEMSMRTGVQQGSVLGPLLFLIFINDLPNSIKHCKIVLYADDTAIFFAHKELPMIQSTLQQDLNALNNWFYENGLVVNCSKTNILLFGSNKRLANVNNLTLKLDEITASHNIASTKYLGLIMDSNLNWHDHIDYIASKVSSRLCLLGRIRKYITVDTCKQLHCSLIQPLCEYCDIVWSNADKTHLQRLLRLQKRGGRLILKHKTNDCRSSALFK